MPQVDIRPLFTPTSQRISITPPPDGSDQRVAAPTPQKRSVRITGEQVTNVGFVIAACLGAVICAAFLFKGGEVFQEVAAWPRELFYGRPAPAPAPHATAANNGPLGADGNTQSSPAPSDTGDPFSPTSKLLDLNPIPTAPRPNGRPSDAPFSSPSNFDRLNMISPSNSPLSRGLTSGTASTAAQTASSGVGNAVAASQTAGVSAAPTAAMAKSAVTATSHKTSSVKTLAARRLSTRSAKRSAVQKSKASVRRTAAHSSISSKTPGKTQTSIGSRIPRSTSSSGSQTANIQSVGGIGHGVGSMNGPGAAGMGGGLGIGHSFGRAGGR